MNISLCYLGLHCKSLGVGKFAREGRQATVVCCWLILAWMTRQRISQQARLLSGCYYGWRVNSTRSGTRLAQQNPPLPYAVRCQAVLPGLGDPAGAKRGDAFGYAPPLPSPGNLPENGLEVAPGRAAVPHLAAQGVIHPCESPSLLLKFSRQLRWQAV